MHLYPDDALIASKTFGIEQMHAALTICDFGEENRNAAHKVLPCTANSNENSTARWEQTTVHCNIKAKLIDRKHTWTVFNINAIVFGLFSKNKILTEKFLDGGYNN